MNLQTLGRESTRDHLRGPLDWLDFPPFFLRSCHSFFARVEEGRLGKREKQEGKETTNSFHQLPANSTTRVNQQNCKFLAWITRKFN